MQVNYWRSLIGCGLFYAGCSMSLPVLIHEQVQVPQCLAGQITDEHQILAENSEFKIINLPADDLGQLTLLADKVGCGHFKNVSSQFAANTRYSQEQLAQRLLLKKTPRASKVTLATYELNHPEEVNAAISAVIPEHITATLTHLTAYHNRSATKDTGVEAAIWIKAQFEQMAANKARSDTRTFLVKTGRYKQPSVVTVIGKDIKAPAVILGAHIDTLDGRMPGAGDDASGSASLLEAARVLLASETPLKNPVYLIWYAAEERGLVGSQYVVQEFIKQSIAVKAVVQMDMTGYRVDRNDPTMWVYTDYTDKKLNQFVAKLIDSYIHVPVGYSQCGYGCSDHASWDEEGIPAAFPCESNFDEHNPHIHTSKDTADLLSLEHMANFSKLALAFAIELATE